MGVDQVPPTVLMSEACHKKQISENDSIHSATKKAFYIRLTFKGNRIRNQVCRKLCSRMNQASPTAQFQTLTATGRTALNPRESCQLSHHDLHMVY